MRDYEWCLSVPGSGDALASKASGTQTQAGNVCDMWGTTASIYKDGFGSAIGPDIGEDGNVYLNVRVAVALVGASAANIVQVYNHTAAASIKSGTKLATLIIPALAAAGNVYSIGFPSNRISLRYLGAVYESSGATLTSATLHTWVGRKADTVYVS